MKTTAFNKTIIKIGGLHIGTESRHRYNGVKLFFIDLFGINIITLKYN